MKKRNFKSSNQSYVYSETISDHLKYNGLPYQMPKLQTSSVQCNQPDLKGVRSISPRHKITINLTEKSNKKYLPQLESSAYAD